ncbi:MAG: recombinase RmuC [Pseudomonadota bacterium]
MTSLFSVSSLLVLALLVVVIVLLVLLLGRLPTAEARRLASDEQQALAAAQAQAGAGQLRQDLRHDLLASAQHIEQALRTEVLGSARDNRQELMQGLSLFQQQLLAQASEVARGQNEQIDAFRIQLGAMQTQLGSSLQAQAQTTSDTLARQSQASREAQDGAFKRLVDGQAEGLARLGQAQTDALQRVVQGQADALQRFGQVQTEQLRSLSEASGQSQAEMRAAMEQRLASLQAAVEQRLLALQADNEKKLEQMRATVDEKLHATLEQRLGESFKQVAERLEQVHRGLGEMQTLAQGVGDLKRVLGNVKSRGVFGEVQLAGLLEQVLTIDQYATNVATVPGSNERVEFAIRLPGKLGTGAGAGGDQPVWLPIDAKFPREDYERLLDAQDRADKDGADAAGKALEQRIRDEARTIATKYVAPPHTTDFAMLFLPTEGLYAELLRRPGLSDELQRKHRVILAGPTTLLAMLNSLQMGFRTLALEKRSSEVWQVLGAVKTEFAKFGDVLEKTKKKLQEASNSIESAEVRTRAMARQLRGVEAMETRDAQALLGLDNEAAVLAADAALPSLPGA